MMRVLLVLTLVAIFLISSLQAETPANPPTTLPARAKVKVFLLIGQSNMAGRGKVEDEDKVAPPRVVTLNKEDKWAPAIDPIHFDKSRAGVGLGRTFGIVISEKLTNDTIALVPAAVGGTTIEQWAKGGTLYENAVRRAKIALQDGQLAGILWHQGESGGKAETYAALAEKLFADLRADLEAKDVPVIVGTLGDFVAGGKTLNPVLKKLPETIPNSACADASGLKDGGDHLHFNAEANRELGKRYAEQWLKLTGQTK